MGCVQLKKYTHPPRIKLTSQQQQKLKDTSVNHYTKGPYIWVWGSTAGIAHVVNSSVASIYIQGNGFQVVRRDRAPVRKELTDRFPDIENGGDKDWEGGKDGDRDEVATPSGESIGGSGTQQGRVPPPKQWGIQDSGLSFRESLPQYDAMALLHNKSPPAPVVIIVIVHSIVILVIGSAIGTDVAVEGAGATGLRT
ncbi:hypothetical protein ARMSODRAFT_979587 [Armillaria solidipes]|uniref:Uncharacterized protein n=1 Tax=Armillaria solidipes TaxID=1076256 RepID=A0A2H3B2N6_9AGAR|nr:hypothetical protein ARMSODRAFT_979587 [Armillaria solidipes]